MDAVPVEPSVSVQSLMLILVAIQAIVVPVIGALVVWMRKLDDRQYKQQADLYTHFVKHEHLTTLKSDMLREFEKIEKMINALFRRTDHKQEGR